MGTYSHLAGRTLDVHAFEWDCGPAPVSIRVTHVIGPSADGRLHIVGHEVRPDGELPRMEYWIRISALPAIMQRSGFNA